MITVLNMLFIYGRIEFKGVALLFVEARSPSTLECRDAGGTIECLLVVIASLEFQRLERCESLGVFIEEGEKGSFQS